MGNSFHQMKVISLRLRIAFNNAGIAPQFSASPDPKDKQGGSILDVLETTSTASAKLTEEETAALPLPQSGDCDLPLGEPVIVQLFVNFMRH